MPVLSPHRSTSASGLSGSYRSTFSSSLDRPYSSYGVPRISTYSERYSSTRSYADSNGRSFYSRAGSITEDGYTTSRYREDSREGSTRRESNSALLLLPVRSSTASTDLSTSSASSAAGGRSSIGNTLTVVESIADLRNKYSASNYVPAVIRNRDVSRSRTVGLPPSSSCAANGISDNVASTKRKVTETNLNNTTNNTNLVGEAEADVDNMRQQDDDNGNRPPPVVTVSVLEMTKKFEKRTAKTTTTTGTARRALAKGDNPPGLTVVGLSAKTLKVAHAGTTTSITTTRATGTTATTITTTTTTTTPPSRHNHTNDFASYIPVESAPPAENGDMPAKATPATNTTTQKGKKANKDVNSTSPRLNRSPISHHNVNSSSGAASGALGGGSSSNRNSLERDGSYPGPATPLASFDRSSPTKQMGLNGLKNIGNTCFMNSVIQCLSNTRPLLEYVKKDGYAGDINTSVSSMKGALMKAFALVIKELWSEDCTDRVVNTVSLKSQIQRFAPRFMGYSQQDAQEFLRYLLEGLHEDVNRVTNKPAPIHTEIDEKLSDHEKASESWQRYLRRDNSKIVDLFVGQFKSTLKCTHCGHCSVTFDPFWDLSLPIPQKTGAIRMSQCLDSFTREETLDGDEKPTCAKCKERRKCTKSFTIHKFPKILVIHLKRFSPTERFRGKLSVTVDFPLEGLDMSGYASESNLQCRYNLYAVSNHSGTTYSGHYTAYCRHPYSTSWHEYNDSRVSSISSKSIVSGEAYVLFYELDGKISAHL